MPHARAIFLDNRYYAQPPGDNGEGDLLGDEQFKFLEAALEHDKLYTFICGGITLTQVATAFGAKMGVLLISELGCQPIGDDL